MAEKEFTGKVVMVTGASSGLGRAAALRFAAEGAQVCLADLNAEGLVETARRIAAAGGNSASYAGDLGDPAHCAQAGGSMCCATLRASCASTHSTR